MFTIFSFQNTESSSGLLTSKDFMWLLVWVSILSFTLIIYSRNKCHNVWGFFGENGVCWSAGSSKWDSKSWTHKKKERQFMALTAYFSRRILKLLSHPGWCYDSPLWRSWPGLVASLNCQDGWRVGGILKMWAERVTSAFVNSFGWTSWFQQKLVHVVMVCLVSFT